VSVFVKLNIYFFLAYFQDLHDSLNIVNHIWIIHFVT